MSEQRGGDSINRARDAELAHADFDQSNIARVYDYMLGGYADFAIDRELAAEGERVFPQAQGWLGIDAGRGFVGFSGLSLCRVRDGRCR